jgi:hypothetical protein
MKNEGINIEINKSDHGRNFSMKAQKSHHLRFLIIKIKIAMNLFGVDSNRFKILFYEG